MNESAWNDPLYVLKELEARIAYNGNIGYLIELNDPIRDIIHKCIEANSTVQS